MELVKLIRWRVCGGLLQDHEGVSKGGFSKYVRSSNAILAEFQGVFEGLKLTKQLGCTKVEMNVDSIEVVRAIEEGVVEYIDCVVILRRIKELVLLMEVGMVSHVFRYANECANLLANQGCLEKSFIYYDRPPLFIKSFMDYDVSGINFSLSIVQKKKQNKFML